MTKYLFRVVYWVFAVVAIILFGASAIRLTVSHEHIIDGLMLYQIDSPILMFLRDWYMWSDHMYFVLVSSLFCGVFSYYFHGLYQQARKRDSRTLAAAFMENRLLTTMVSVLVFIATPLFILSVGAGMLYLMRPGPPMPVPDDAMFTSSTVEVADMWKTEDPPLRDEDVSPFDTVSSAPRPPFLSTVETSDLAVYLNYSVPGGLNYYAPRDAWGDHFLLRPNSDQNIRHSGGSVGGFDIFSPVGSHSYGGSEIRIGDTSEKYSVAYIGVRMDDPSLVSAMSVEFGIDPIGRGDKEKDTWFSRMLRYMGLVLNADACGPGLYLQKVGHSALELVEYADGIAWYKLVDPVAFYGKTEANWCWYYGGSSDCKFEIRGNTVQMHLTFVPNDKAGVFHAQLANIIFQNEEGDYVQPNEWKSYEQYYRAYFAATEQGAVGFEYNPQSEKFELVVRNVGEEELLLDAHSLDAMRRVGRMNPIEGFSIRDVDGLVVARLYYSAFANAVHGERLAPGEELRYAFFDIADLEKDALYFVTMHMSEENDPPLSRAPVFFAWDMMQQHEVYPITPTAPIRSHIISVDGRKHVSVELLRGRSARVDDGRQRWVAMVGPHSSSSILYTATGLKPEELFPENFSVNMGSKAILAPEQLIAQDHAPSTLFLEIVARAASDLLAELQTGEGFEIGETFESYSGEAVTQYRRDGFVGYVVAHKNISMVYEVPEQWMANERLARYIEWMVRANPVASGF